MVEFLHHLSLLPMLHVFLDAFIFIEGRLEEIKWNSEKGKRRNKYAFYSIILKHLDG